MSETRPEALVLISCDRGLGKMADATCVRRWRIANGQEPAASPSDRRTIRESPCRACVWGARRSSAAKGEPMPDLPPVVNSATAEDRCALVSCGKLFKVEKPFQRFCSDDCRVAYGRAIRPVKLPPAPPPVAREAEQQSAPAAAAPPLPPLKCVCGKTFTPTNNAHRFCSVPCRKLRNGRPPAPAAVPAPATTRPTRSEIGAWLDQRRGDIRERLDLPDPPTTAEMIAALPPGEDEPMPAPLVFEDGVPQAPPPVWPEAERLPPPTVRVKVRTTAAPGTRDAEQGVDVSAFAPGLAPGVPYVVRFPRFEVECRTLDDLEALVKRAGGW